eukprot:TRINITY_DN71215_c0_g1_i1.p1 TRINITY_DN71215_c0_g1~~TRINITY_DN71215_c0_g1_i1.p1  ORF type:complete len:250 (-),score=-10.02 TRINITY_DN71215_c0_g1_i1:89-814(-)
MHINKIASYIYQPKRMVQSLKPQYLADNNACPCILGNAQYSSQISSKYFGLEGWSQNQYHHYIQQTYQPQSNRQASIIHDGLNYSITISTVLQIYHSYSLLPKQSANIYKCKPTNCKQCSIQQTTGSKSSIKKPAPLEQDTACIPIHQSIHNPIYKHQSILHCLQILAKQFGQLIWATKRTNTALALPQLKACCIREEQYMHSNPQPHPQTNSLIPKPALYSWHFKSWQNSATPIQHCSSN